jgi:adenylate kinase
MNSVMEYDVIFFLGLPGSGKGTQAKILSDKLGFFYWENRAVLREFAKGQTPLALEIKQCIDKGSLIGDDAMFAVLNERIDEIPVDRGIIFDGIPRRESQARYLLDLLKNRKGREKFATVHLDVPPEESTKRLLLRSKNEIAARTDDNPEIIAVRVKEQQVPGEVIKFMKENTEFFRIDGLPLQEEVAKQIDSALKVEATILR